MKCPYCEGIIGPKSFKNSYILCCEHCQYIYSLSGPGHLIAKTWEDDRPVSTGIDSPDFEIDDLLICVDSKHKMFLDYGTVLSNDLLHVRIDFKGTKTWMDKNAMQEIPQEWL